MLSFLLDLFRFPAHLPTSRAKIKQGEPGTLQTINESEFGRFDQRSDRLYFCSIKPYENEQEATISLFVKQDL
jgi:hypothetical protein